MENTVSPLVAFKRLAKTATYSAIATAVFWASQADAQLLNNITMGNPKALALGNAVTADPPGIDSIHFNPAGLAKIKGRQREVKLLMAKMDLKSKFGEPTRPDDTVKQTYYNMNSDCQSQYPANDANAWQQCWKVDTDVADRSSSSGDPVLMLPFVGLTDLPFLAVPTGGIAFEDSSHGWTFGTAVYTPEGVGYSRDDSDPGAYQGIRVGVTRLTYFSPTIAIPVTDTLSVGAGINFSYQGMGIQTKFRAPLITTKFIETINSVLDTNGPIAPLSILQPYDSVGLLEIEMDDYLSVGFNFGLLWEPYEWLSFGFAYRSESTSHLSGDFKMTNSNPFLATTSGLADLGLDNVLFLAGGAPFNAQKVEKGSVKLDYITPQNLSFGTSIRVLPQLKVNVDLKWVEYSAWDTLDFKFDRNVDFLTLASVVNFAAGMDFADPNEMRIPRYYKDVWSMAFGAEYTMNDNLVLRAGYEPRTSAIPHDRTDLLFPISDAQLFSCGFGMQFNKTTRIEGAFGYLKSSSNTAAGESRNANSNIEGDVVYNPYFSTPFKSETTAYLVALSLDQKF